MSFVHYLLLFQELQSIADKFNPKRCANADNNNYDFIVYTPVYTCIRIELYY